MATFPLLSPLAAAMFPVATLLLPDPLAFESNPLAMLELLLPLALEFEPDAILLLWSPLASLKNPLAIFPLLLPLALASGRSQNHLPRWLPSRWAVFAARRRFYSRHR